ncbi:MAG: DNA replication/repair protein RecF [Microcoleaceae cyanobacterium]|jgi:DNA replication and repair protein RecF
MFLKTLRLRQFRNYQEQKVVFEAPKTILVGNNAQGKSNLLEAVELLSTLKSHRANRDRELILETQSIAHIEGSLERITGIIDLSLTLRSQGRRTVFINGNSPPRNVDFLSVLNVVEFSSLDLDLVRGAPEERRNWIDRLVIQLEPIYANILYEYNKVLRQRNALLRTEKNLVNISVNTQTLVTTNQSSFSQLALWDAQLVATGTRVIRRRDRILKRLIPLAQNWHHAISGSQENLDIEYIANVSITDENLPLSPEIVQEAFFTKIKEKAIAEQYQGTTLAGPHRDDIAFTINKTPARQYASQGQQRTLVLALKLAELQLIEEVIGEPPLLLLDDVLAELDLNRQNQLLEVIQDRFQTLITTTHLSAFDAQWLRETQVLSVHSGKISEF